MTTTEPPAPDPPEERGPGKGTFFFLGFALGFVGVIGAAFLVLILVVDPDYAAQASAGNAARSQTTTMVDEVAAGKLVAESAGCVACHSADGSAAVGPAWLGLYGAERLLDDGTSVLADSAYLRESILDPPIRVVAGYQANLMPTTYADTLSAQDIDHLLAYIESLAN